MTTTEILAPAGSMESVIAAVRSGADAVYIGAKEFSARASAENFGFDEIKECTSYCHIRGVKVYLAANTLVFDEEIEDALKTVQSAYKAGIDAVIVQDMGLAMLIKQSMPDLKLHASTQMSIHTPQGAIALKELGFHRVVLSRELSKAEIAQIRQACDIELEVFVHGALCMSVSGQCYFSAMLGGRSGNRGKCAQPCRLPFKLKGGNGYALSLKDSSLTDYLNELKEMGIESAKIEGRMKRPEYVSAAVTACREALDTGCVSCESAEALRGVFSRTGFTCGYYKGKRDKTLFGYRQKEDVTSATNKLLAAIRNTYKSERQSIAVDASLSLFAGKKASLTISDGLHTVSVSSEAKAEVAISSPVNRELAYKNLSKTGGTPYLLNNLCFESDENSTIPMSSLNLMRRQALELLSEKRSKAKDVEIRPVSLNKTGTHKQNHTTGYRARFTDTDVPDCFKDAELIYLPLFSPVAKIEDLKNKGFNVAVEIPRGMFGMEEQITLRLCELKALGINHVLASNLGAVHLAKSLGLKIHGGFGLNITNTESLCFFESYGLEDTELSFELDKRHIEGLGSNLKRGIISAGYLPLMLTRACPALNSQNKCVACNRCVKMQDRMGESFILHCDKICTEVLNCVNLTLCDEIDIFCGVDFSVFRFTVENSVEKVENKRSFSSKQHNFSKITRGLYYRGVK